MSAIIKSFQEMREMSGLQLRLENIFNQHALNSCPEIPPTSSQRYVIARTHHSRNDHIQYCSPWKHGGHRKLIIKPMEGSSPIKETTLFVQVSVKFNN